MKNAHTCPKCKSTDVIRVEGVAMGYGVGNYIQVGLKTVCVHRYVCCSCGFSEEWIDKEDIPKLEKKYK